MIRFPSKNNGGGGDDGDNGAAACSKAKAGSLRSSEMEDFILSIRVVSMLRRAMALDEVIDHVVPGSWEILLTISFVCYFTMKRT